MGPEEAGRLIAQVAAPTKCLTHAIGGYYLVPFYKMMADNTIKLTPDKGVHTVRLFRPAGSRNHIMSVCDCLDMGRRDVLKSIDFSQRSPSGQYGQYTSVYASVTPLSAFTSAHVPLQRSARLPSGFPCARTPTRPWHSRAQTSPW